MAGLLSSDKAGCARGGRRRGVSRDVNLADDDFDLISMRVSYTSGAMSRMSFSASSSELKRTMRARWPKFP